MMDRRIVRIYVARGTASSVEDITAVDWKDEETFLVERQQPRSDIAADIRIGVKYYVLGRDGREEIEAYLRGVEWFIRTHGEARGRDPMLALV